MDTGISSIHTQAREWLDKGYNNQQITDELRNKGVEERHVPEMLKEIVRLRNSRKTASGMVLIMIGAVMCLASCVITLTSSYGDMSFALYGLTTAGILVAFGGLIKIFG